MKIAYCIYKLLCTCRSGIFTSLGSGQRSNFSFGSWELKRLGTTVLRPSAELQKHRFECIFTFHQMSPWFWQLTPVDVLLLWRPISSLEMIRIVHHIKMLPINVVDELLGRTTFSGLVQLAARDGKLEMRISERGWFRKLAAGCTLQIANRA